MYVMLRLTFVYFFVIIQSTLEIERTTNEISRDNKIKECIKTAETIKPLSGKVMPDDKSMWIQFFQNCIVDIYNFKIPSEENPREFIKIPKFTESDIDDVKPGSNYFNKIAKVSQIFFKTWRSWKNITHAHTKVASNGEVLNCQNMLYISAARYIYNIYVLTKVTENITSCKELPGRNKRMEIPDSVCYLRQLDRLTCISSDSDVRLIGKDAEDVVKLYKDYFNEIYDKFKCGVNNNESCSTQVLLGNNVVSCNILEATPELFVVKKQNTSDDTNTELYEDMRVSLARDDRTKWFQWNDIAFGLLRIKQTRPSFYEEYSRVIMKSKANKNYFLSVKENILNLNLKNVSNNTNDYTSRAYLSFGALRTIVVSAQIKSPLSMKRLSLNDYWASILENWGLALSYLHHCPNKVALRGCFKEASRYLWRLFACMKASRHILHAGNMGDNITITGNSVDVKDVTVTRDYFAELLFIFEKRKLYIPLEYYSPSQGRIGNWQKKIQNILQCKTAVECIEKINNIVLSYSDMLGSVSKSIDHVLRYPDDYTFDFIAINQQRNSVKNNPNTYNWEGEYNRQIIVKSVNREYYNHVTKVGSLLVKEYDMNTKDRSYKTNLNEDV